MEDNLNNFNSVELEMLLKLSDMAEFHVLQRLHDIILNEMKDKTFNEIEFSEEQRVQHGIRKGHKMAWDRDKELKKIVNNFIELKTKFDKKKK